ncbi:MAG: cupin domain-containing protein [Chitinophagaceae bacterium]|nr:MAG: cupin domain-containing protein [Chitinophagaceae bacterium]
MPVTAHINVFIKDNEVPWEPAGDGVNRKVMAWDDRLMLVRVEFTNGSIGALHQHHHSQITHVESGSFEVQISGEKKVLGPGDVYIVPPHAIHGCVCLQAGVLIDVFSPMREDFVK